MNGFCVYWSDVIKPGGDLLFHRLGDSTIGAVGFHGRVRDGIGWDTDAMATRQWGRRGRRKPAGGGQRPPSDGFVYGMKSMHLAWDVTPIRAPIEVVLRWGPCPTLLLGVWSSQARQSN